MTVAARTVSRAVDFLRPRGSVPVDRRMQWRAVIVLTGLGAVILALGGRVVWIQGLHHERFARLAANQHTRVAEVPAPLGRVTDRRSRILATSVQAPSICADPAAIFDKGTAAARLAEALGIAAGPLRERLIDHGHRRFIWVARRVDRAAAQRVADLNLDGVWTVKEPQRCYPNGSLAAQVIGFRGIDGEGLEGLERHYDAALRGTPGEEVYRVDALGRRMAGPGARYRPPQPGASLVTTLDCVVQQFLEDELDQMWAEWNPVAISAIVMVPDTGEILAMSNRPSYSLDAPGTAPPDSRRNRCITDPVEPGSTFKPFIASAVLSRHLAGLDDRFFCHNGLYVTHGRRLRDHRPHGWLTFREIVVKSSNIGMARLGEVLGAAHLQQALRDFGFGRRTGVDLPGEDPGKVTSPRQWSHYTTTSVPMGHEVSVTPLQLATAFCAIANGGYLVRPRLARCLVGPDGTVVEDHREPVRVQRAIPQEIAATMIDPVLTNVVEEGTGRRAQLGRYRLFGKTGTAQKLLPDGRGYSHTAFVSSFIGAAPAERAEVCVLIMVNEPRKPGASRYGGTVAAPSVARVIEKTLDYLEATATADLRSAETRGV